MNTDPDLDQTLAYKGFTGEAGLGPAQAAELSFLHDDPTVQMGEPLPTIPDPANKRASVQATLPGEFALSLLGRILRTLYRFRCRQQTREEGRSLRKSAPNLSLERRPTMRYVTLGNLPRVTVALLFLSLAPTSRTEATINGTTWFPIGPAPVSWWGRSSGRATAVAVNPFNVQDIWLGTAGGGVWHSTDGGKTWTPTSDDQKSLAIGAIALADCEPAGCSSVYAGTGENAIRRDTYYGAGLLRGFVYGGQVVWDLRTGVPYNFTHGSIYNVVIDPTTSYPNRTIYITLSSGVTASASESTVTAPEPLGGYGIYKSTDDGLTWNKLFVEGAEFDKPTDLEIWPNYFYSDILYAGFLGKGIFRTSDGGLSWCPLDWYLGGSWTCKTCLGLPQAGTFDHVEIEISRSDGFVYATHGQCPDPLSESCGSFLYSLGPSYPYLFCGGYPVRTPRGDCRQTYSRYTHALAADPAHTGTVFVGGLSLCKSTDYGKTWINSDWQPDYKGTLHLDHRAVVFHPFSSNYVYDVNDGGFAISTDSGNNWTNRNDDLQTLEFQSIATSPLTTKVIGGFQDNALGMWKGTRLWDTKGSGDVGFTVMDLDNEENMYWTTNKGGNPIVMVPVRSLKGGDSPEYVSSGIPDAEPRAFYPPLVQDPDPSQTTTQHALYFGTVRLWKSTDDAWTWTDVSPVPPYIPAPEILYGADVITAIAVAPRNPNHIYIGYYSGRTFWTTAACISCWSTALSGFLQGPVTWIAVDPSNENVAYATTSGFGPGIHVYRTDDGGRNWVQVPPSHPDLYGLPANTLTVEPGGPDRPNLLWLGTDRGIYRSEDSGQTWYWFSYGLPNVPVYQIALDPVHDRAIAATHGRGAYILTGPALSASLGCASDAMSGIQVFGNGLPAGQVCTMRILRKDATQCAPPTSLDALGGTIHTNSKGELWRSDPNTNTYDAQSLVWACLAGKCLGGIPVTKCDQKNNPISAIEATCGTAVASIQVSGCAMMARLPSAWLELTDIAAGAIPSPALAACFDPELAGGGIFHLLPTVQSGDGSSRRLCEVSVPFASGDTAEMLLENARDAVNADATCQASGVSAEVVPAVLEPEAEDIFPSRARLGLLAPGLTGGQLVPAWRYGPGQADGACFSIDNLGVPVTDQLRPMRVRFVTSPGGALGGTLTLRERSDLGDCAVTVPTFPGDSGGIIASALEAQFQGSAPGAPSPDCPIAANPHDVLREGDSIVTTAATRIEICVNDPGIGVSTAPREICFADAECEDGSPCTLNACDAVTGRCQTASAPDGLPCDDGDACTIGGTCLGGTCGTPVICDDGDACTTDTCDPATGLCLSTPVICDDLNICTQDSCNPETGQCLFSPTSGAVCDDGNPCTTGDTCVSMPGTGAVTCQGAANCADPDPCTVDLCDPATGACLHQPILCDDHNPCTVDSCLGGTCTSMPVFGQTCDDGNRCTVGETCVSDPAGLPVCQGQAVNCNDDSTCTVDRCNPVTGGCDHTPVPLSEVQDLLFTSYTSLTWSPTPGASFYNTYRGTIPADLLGSRPLPPFDQTCFEMDDAHGDGLLVSTDVANPPTGTAFYYDVTLVTPCGEGPIGRASNTRVIPNTSPCGLAP